MFDRDLIDRAYDDLDLLPEAAGDVEAAIAALDRGEVRVAAKGDDGWVVDETVKRAIMLYFRLRGLDTMVAGPFEYHDKIPTKRDLAEPGHPGGAAGHGQVRGVLRTGRGGDARATSTSAPTSVPGPWSTPGPRSAPAPRSAATCTSQVASASAGSWNRRVRVPVIVEDGAFIGSRCILVEGVIVEEGAVLGANTVVTSSTKIIDVTGDDPGRVQGPDPRQVGGHPRHEAQEVPCRHVRDPRAR